MTLGIDKQQFVCETSMKRKGPLWPSLAHSAINRSSVPLVVAGTDLIQKFIVALLRWLTKGQKVARADQTDSVPSVA